MHRTRIFINIPGSRSPSPSKFHPPEIMTSPLTINPAIIPINGSIVAAVTTAVTQPTSGSASIAAGAFSGNPVTACSGTYLAALPISPSNNITAAKAIIIAAARTGLGAAAVPLIIGSNGAPPKIALANPDRPAIIFVASKMLAPDPVIGGAPAIS